MVAQACSNYADVAIGLVSYEVAMDLDADSNSVVLVAFVENEYASDQCQAGLEVQSIPDSAGTLVGQLTKRSRNSCSVHLVENRSSFVQ